MGCAFFVCKSWGAFLYLGQSNFLQVSGQPCRVLKQMDEQNTLLTLHAPHLGVKITKRIELQAEAILLAFSQKMPPCRSRTA